MGSDVSRHLTLRKTDGAKEGIHDGLVVPADVPMAGPSIGGGSGRGACSRPGGTTRYGQSNVPTGRALQFIRAQNGVATPSYKRKLLRRLPDIEQALAIQDGLPQVRFEIEARFLARQSAREIARRVGLRAETVVTFESLFFNVCDRINATTYIAIEVIDSEPLQNASALDYAALTKLVAYHAGPVALEAMLRYQTYKSAGEDAPPLSSRDRLLFDSIELFLQAQSLRLDPATAQDLLKKWPILQPIIQKVPRERSLADEFARQTQLALDNIAAATWSPAEKVVPEKLANEQVCAAAQFAAPSIGKPVQVGGMDKNPKPLVAHPTPVTHGIATAA